jgi:hypothetical protein
MDKVLNQINHAVNKYNIVKFWDNEYQNLTYINEDFNDTVSVVEWKNLGYGPRFTGEMCDMRSPQPSWNQKFVELFTAMGWKDIGTSYYRMNTNTVLPVHGDLYKRYIDLFNLHGQEHTIRRAIVFLEDWKSGHYFEAMSMPMTGWSAGTVVEWTYDTPHMAANIGLDPRYTLQITGHL